MEMDFEPTQPPRMIGFAALWAAVITMACVLIGEGAVQYVALNPPASDAQLATDAAAKPARPNFNTIDYATTGATRGETVVISPCTGKQVEP